MKKRDIVIGAVVLLALAGVIFWRQRSRTPKEEMKVPETLSVEDNLEDKFKIQIPEDVDRAELKDVSGGNSSAIATRKYADGKFTHTVLADLPDPSEQGAFYQGWLEKGEKGKEGYAAISTGKLRIAKGGWMLQYESSTDYSEYKKVLITQEKSSDSQPEKTILEGSF